MNFSARHTRFIVVTILVVALTGIALTAATKFSGRLSGFANFSRSSVAAQGASDSFKVSDSAQQQIKALIEEKTSRTSAQQKLDSQLLYAAKMQRGEEIASGVRQLSLNLETDAEATTVVDITAIVGGTLIEEIEAKGAEVISVYAAYNSIRARVPLNRLEEIAGLSQVRFIQPKQDPHLMRERAKGTTTGKESSRGFSERANRVQGLLPKAVKALTPNANVGFAVPVSAAFIGSKTSEGDVTHRAAASRTTFGANGAGVRIGVISDGVANLAASQASGDLPSNVTVLPGLAGAGDEGTAMLEIIHDLAPGAQLYFATGFGSIAQFAQAIRDLRAAGCDIIVDDLAYFTETPFQDGQASSVVSTTNGGAIWQAVNDVTASGALYFSSAGNFGNKNDNSSGVWQGDFADGGTLALVPGGTVHNFGGGAQFDKIITSSNTGSLFWSDPLGGSNNDYDLFVLNSTGTSVVASSTNVQNGTQDPVELVGGILANNRMVILKKASAANRFLYMSTNGGRLEVGTEGVAFGHSCAASAFSVAATPAATAFGTAPNPTGPFPNPFVATNTVEIFSSDGPRRIFFNANGTPITPGNFLATGGTLRQKPDITAADGVMVTGAGGFPTRFFGTSAAAPHAAAIAALLRSSNQTLTPAQVRTALTSSAIDIEAAGVDRDSGAGIIMAFQALQSIGAVASANLQTGTIAATESGGNGNTFIQPGESANLNVQLLNTGPVAATAVSATLTTTTPGVNITTGTSTYSNLNATNGSATNATPFVFNLTAAAVCPLKIEFTLTVTFTGAGSPKILPFAVQTGLPAINIASVMDAQAPNSVPGISATTGLQMLRLNRSGLTNACGVPATCPGTFSTGTRRYDAYTFANCATASTCITVAFGTACVGGSQLFAAAYLGNFDPNNVCANYLSDAGNSPGATPINFSFMVPAGATFTVVVNEVNANGGTGCGYSLNLSGLCCQPIACPTATQLAPTTGVPGSNVMVTGSNLNNVTAVKFNGDATAAFSVINNSTLNVVIPNGAKSGPISLSSPGCADAQTPTFTLPTNLATNNEIAIDDGTMETISSVSSSGFSYFVNRLTPANYPSTVTKLVIFLPGTVSSPPSGTPFDLLVGTNPSGGTIIDGTRFTITPTTVQSGGSFAIYNVPPTTITSGDFIVGFRIPFVSGVFPAASDTSSPSQNRSYFSTDGSTFVLTARNYGFRAATLQGCPSVTTISPPNGAAGTALTLAGVNLNGVTALKFFNNVTSPFTVVSPTQITTTVPNAAVTGPITLSKSGCPDMTAPVFLVSSCPTVTGISPISGNAGNTVTITGANFTDVTAVKFANNLMAQFTIVSATSITATVPAGAVTGPITISKANCADVQTAAFTICAPITINPATLSAGSVGLAYNQTLTATGGTAAYGYTVTTGALPSGLTLATGGTISGAPIVSGTFNFTITATDANGCTGTRAYSLVVTCPTITLSPTSLPNGLVGSAYNQTVVASPTLNTGAYSYAVTTGNLPAGLSLNSTTGAITGNPTTGGTSNFTVTALGLGCSGSQAYSIFVQPLCPTINGINPTNGIVGASVTITGTNFTGIDSVKFANNVTATFTVASNTQITTTVPAGAVTGAITISRQFCSDVMSATYTVLPTPTITLSPSSPLIGVGQTASYTATISPALPTAINLTLTSSNTTVAAVPVSPSIPAGQTSAQFNVVGNSAGTTTITAAVPALYGTASANSSLTVAAGFEGDVTPRPNGDVNGQITINDWNQVGRFIAGLDSIALGSEFQRADCAPRGTLGDGLLTSRDWVQAGRYAAGLDPVVGMGGPTAPASFKTNEEPLSFAAPSLVRAEMVKNQSLVGNKDQQVIKLTAQGGENALSFSLMFQPSLWKFSIAELTDETAGATLIVNREQATEGKLGFMFAYPTGKTLSPGEIRLFTVTFEPVTNAAESLFVGFGDYPTAREVSDAKANRLPSSFVADYSFAGLTACANVSAASFAADRLASEQIVAVFGSDLATSVTAAQTLPLPTALGGASVRITDSKGLEQLAGLFFVSSGQINYLLPAGLAEGIARVTITANGKTSIGLIDVAPIAPSLFAANSDGQGLAAAVLLRIRADGSQSYEAIARFDSASEQFVAVPIEFGGSSEQLFLLLYGTGFRHLEGRAVKATVGGMETPMPFAGAVAGFAGLDQINLNLPRSLTGRGEVEINLTIDDRSANAVKIVAR